MNNNLFIWGRPDQAMAPTRYLPTSTNSHTPARAIAEVSAAVGEAPSDLSAPAKATERPKRMPALRDHARRAHSAVLPMLAALVLGACAFDEEPSSAEGRGESDSAAVPAVTPAPPALGVEVAVARQDTLAQDVALTGRIEAVQAIDLRPEVEGRVVEILFREGQRVKAGTPLFRIDDAELRAQVARATADRDLARQTLERTRGLIAEQASARTELERAEALARSTSAQLDLLSIRLARTVVRAPFTGIVGRRLVSLGDYVSPQVRLTSLQTSDPQRVALDVPERFAGVLRTGQRVAFGVAAYPGTRFTGTVSFVDPVVALPSRTITVIALAANPDGRLQPGMFAEARLATSVRLDAVTIPEEALLPAPGGRNAAWAVVDGTARRRDVTIGIRQAGRVEVREGLSAGEQVVVGGVLQLADGMPVKPTPVAARSTGRAP